MKNVCDNLSEILKNEKGMPGVGVCIWRENQSEEHFEEESVGEFLSRKEHQSGEWLIDGGWGGPPGPIKVKWNNEKWINLGFPPWDYL